MATDIFKFNLLSIQICTFCLFFLPNFPGPSFIPCSLSIPDSRVCAAQLYSLDFLSLTHETLKFLSCDSKNVWKHGTLQFKLSSDNSWDLKWNDSYTYTLHYELPRWKIETPVQSKIDDHFAQVGAKLIDSEPDLKS